jgi:hypothetical protein
MLQMTGSMFFNMMHKSKNFSSEKQKNFFPQKREIEMKSQKRKTIEESATTMTEFRFVSFPENLILI